MPETDTPTDKLKGLKIRVSRKDAHAIKVYCAKKGVTLNAWVTGLMLDAIKAGR